MSLTLRRFTALDEAAARRGHEQLALEEFDFLGEAARITTSWTEIIELYADWETGHNLPAGYVPAYSLAAVVADELVGRTSIRLEMNNFLATRGGHIGYAVLPEHRRRGYATEILRQSLDLIRIHGITRVLVTCDDANIGSATVIERCGGVLEGVVDDPDGDRYRRYWISTELGISAQGVAR